VRRVLDGTAGLPDYTWGWPGQTTQWSLARCQGMPLGGPAAPPGSAIRYGSCTSLVLGTIIEQVSQEVWEGFLFNGTLSAVGLTNTSRLTDALAASVVARAYDSAEVAANTTYDDYYEAYATVHDIYAYDNALFGGKLLAPPYLTMLFAPRTTTMQDSGMSGITARGIGYLWQIGTAFGQRVVYTMAANRGFSLLNLRFPDAGVTIVVISNETQDDAAGIALHLAALALGRA
jgi:CubicO group peptidase (beta-lactamase class C family)